MQRHACSICPCSHASHLHRAQWELSQVHIAQTRMAQRVAKWFPKNAQGVWRPRQEACGQNRESQIGAKQSPLYGGDGWGMLAVSRPGPEQVRREVSVVVRCVRSLTTICYAHAGGARRANQLRRRHRCVGRRSWDAVVQAVVDTSDERPWQDTAQHRAALEAQFVSNILRQAQPGAALSPRRHMMGDVAHRAAALIIDRMNQRRIRAEC